MIRNALRVSCLFITILAAFFLAKGGLALSPEAISELAATKYDYNPSLILSFSAQRADTFVGVLLLLIGFLLQLADVLWPRRVMDVEVQRSAIALTISIMFATVVCCAAYYASGKIATSTEIEARKALDVRGLGKVSQGGYEQTKTLAHSPPGLTSSRETTPTAEPPIPLRRTFWWATFTAITATVLAIALRNSTQSSSVWAARWLALSLILCIAKFFQWTHYDVRYPPFGCVLYLLDLPIIGHSVAFLAVLVFFLGFFELYRRA